jgi:hypothetical protein
MRPYIAVIRVYDEGGNVIETQADDFRESSANPYSPANAPSPEFNTNSELPVRARAKTFTEGLASSCNRAATLRSDALPPSL